MNPSGVLVPYATFVEYRDRRALAAAAAVKPAADSTVSSRDSSGCVDIVFPTAGTTARSGPDKERIIPS